MRGLDEEPSRWWEVRGVWQVVIAPQNWARAGGIYFFYIPKRKLAQSIHIRLVKYSALRLSVPHFSEFAKTPKIYTAQEEVITLLLTPKSEEPGVWSVCCCLCLLLPLGDTVDNWTYTVHKRWWQTRGPETGCYESWRLEDPPSEPASVEWEFTGPKLLILGSLGLIQSHFLRWQTVTAGAWCQDWTKHLSPADLEFLMSFPFQGLLPPGVRQFFFFSPGNRFFLPILSWTVRTTAYLLMATCLPQGIYIFSLWIGSTAFSASRSFTLPKMIKVT